MSRFECPSAEKAFQLNEFNIQSVANVVELEVGDTAHGLDETGATRAVSLAAREDINNKAVVIIPTKNEPVDKLVNVIRAIPRGILIGVVSNSSRTPGDDKYKEEVEAVRAYCRLAGNRPGFIIHQKDPGAGEAFEAAGENTITDGDHKIRNGKGEGMILGLAVVATRYPDRRFVGFVDSDNSGPGSVTEYCMAYASGFHMYREQPNIMVRIQWGSKPKSFRGRLDGTREGRSSVIVNKWLNHLLTRCPNGSSTANPSGVMVTGNAGEHAMTMDLAVQLPFAGGYAIEPHHIVALLSMATEDPRHGQRANGANAQASGNTHRRGHQSGRFSATVVQIKSVNPHIHSPGDENHIRGMFLEGLGSIYHHLPSGPFRHPRATNGHNGDWQGQFRGEMLKYLENKGLGGTIPPAPRVYKPLGSLDLRKMHTIMTQKCRTFEVMGRSQPGLDRSGARMAMLECGIPDSSSWFDCIFTSSTNSYS